MHENKNEMDAYHNGAHAITYTNNATPVYNSSNCLCEKCNYKQEIKLDKISSFQPKNEVNFELI